MHSGFQSFNAIIAVYLVVQAMITVASFEVTFRYSRWYFSTSGRDGLLLRALILGIAITHLMIFGDCLSSIYERLVNPELVGNFMEHASNLYFRLIFLRFGLYIGVIVHLVPVWRIVHRYSGRETLMAVLYRAIVGVILYVGILWHYGLLSCYLLMDVTCPY